MRYRALVAFAIGLAAVGAARAQGAPKVTLMPSAAVECLLPSPLQRGLPEYPFEEYKRAIGGEVKVALDFTSPTEPPTMVVLASEGPPAFVDAVRAYVKKLRAPCIGSAGTARLLQDYAFKPGPSGRVTYGPVTDLADADRRERVKCVVHQSGGKAPDYPQRALQREIAGRVDAELRFEAPDRPPTAKIYSRLDARILAREIEDWVKGLRMPCVGDSPVAVEFGYHFLLQGDASGFKPMRLQSLLGAVRGIERQHLTLDTTAMGCPFDVRLEYRRPERPNLVGIVGDYDPRREALVAWLSTVELDLPGPMLNAVYLDTADIVVPCLRIDLKPKE